jgi:hypothetical protein
LRRQKWEVQKIGSCVSVLIFGAKYFFLVKYGCLVRFAGKLIIYPMTDIITQETIQNQNFTIRGKQVIMDRDLAIMYNVETKVLNQAVKRNLERFPIDDFIFQMTETELKNWKSQIVTSNKEIMGLRKLPLLFCEPGVIMLASVLRSTIAINVSIQITRAFVELRRFLRDNAEVFVRLENVERKQSLLQFDTDRKFEKVFNALQSNDLKPKQGIFYDGQVFDAYTFIADLIREAKTSIVLIDNYVDDTVLRMFAKREKQVSLTIYTKKDCVLLLDVAKYRAQYGPLHIKEFANSHDRFLILDGTDVYHIGASLKDLGKKWFGFSKMELSALSMLSKLK